MQLDLEGHVLLRTGPVVVAFRLIAESEGGAQSGDWDAAPPGHPVGE